MNKLLSRAATVALFAGAHLFADDFDSAGVKLHYQSPAPAKPAH